MGNIRVVNAMFGDLPLILELENKIWPPGTRAPMEKFEKRLSIFPTGFFIAYKDSVLIGASTSQIINYSPGNEPNSWEIITDNGNIEKTHDPKGNALYVVSLGAISRSGGGSALLSRQKLLAKNFGLQYLILGARIPGYDKYCRHLGEIPVEEYAALKNVNGKLLDDELRFYEKNGLNLIRIISGYMEDDSESRNYGAIMVWENSNQ